MLIYQKLFTTLLILLLSACANLISSGIQSGLVLVVSHHDKVVEKKQKKYTAVDKCIVHEGLSPFDLGEAIIYGEPITDQYHIILSLTGDINDVDPVEPHQLAFAFYLIADKIHDIRAPQRIEWLKSKMQPNDIETITNIIETKYLSSYLEKCFSVPEMYRINKTTRELIINN